MHLGDAEFGTDLRLRQVVVVAQQQDPLLALGQLYEQVPHQVAVFDPGEGRVLVAEPVQQSGQPVALLGGFQRGRVVRAAGLDAGEDLVLGDLQALGDLPVVGERP